MICLAAGVVRPDSARDPLRSHPPLDRALVLGLPLDQFDESGRLIRRTEVGGAKTFYTYDERGRLIRTVFPDRTTEELEYGSGPLDGKLVAKRDRTGVLHLYFYDDKGKLVGEKIVK